MALQSGQITGNDLSPAANILGTQIADKTLQFRNFNEDVFKIIGTFTASFSLTSTSGDVGVMTVTITHNQGKIPLTMSTVSTTADWNGGTGILPIPYFNAATNTGVDAAALFIIVSYVRVKNVTTTTITYECGVLAGGTTLAGTITCYVIEQSAT